MELILHDIDFHILSPFWNLVDKLDKTGRTGRIPTRIATGDSTGCVVIWKDLFHTRAYTHVYHWHTQPITETAFSNLGGSICVYWRRRMCASKMDFIKSTLDNDLFPAGHEAGRVDRRMNCLILNSRNGHVQFYNTRTISLL